MAGAIDYPISAPSEGAMYNTPYGVLTSYNFYGRQYTGAYSNDINVHIGGYNGMDMAISLIINIIETAATNEEARESQLLNNYINLIPQGTKLRKDFEGLIRNKQYSQAFDTLQKVLSKMYDFDKTLQENQKAFTEINDLFLNKNIIHALADELGKVDHVTTHADFNKINLNMTGNQILDNIINKVLQQAKEKLETSQQIQYYENFLQKVRFFMEEIFIDSYGANVLTESLSTLENNKKIQTQRRAKGGKHAEDPLNQLIWNQIWGLLNGIPNEIVLDLNGGVKTGTIKDSRGLNIKGDAYTLMSAQQEIVLKEGSQEKLDFLKITHKSELENFLSQGSFQDNFIIISSAKDQSLSADFNNQFSKNNIKFAEPASLNERIGNIREFGAAANAMGQGLNDLIFALVNLEYDMVCAGEEGAVKQALGALCANWMFDDFGDIVVNVPLSNNASKICVYYINGWYYTLSDILKRTVNKVKNKKQSDLVSVKLSIPKESSYNAAKSVPEGIERWEATRNNIMSKTTLGFELNVKNLFNAFY